MVGIEKYSSFIGRRFQFLTIKLLITASISWSQNSDELIYLVEKYLLNERKLGFGYSHDFFGKTVRITPQDMPTLIS